MGWPSVVGIPWAGPFGTRRDKYWHLVIGVGNNGRPSFRAFYYSARLDRDDAMPTFKIPRLGRPTAPARADVATVYVEEARRRLKEGKSDTDALFTLAAWHAVHADT